MIEEIRKLNLATDGSAPNEIKVTGSGEHQYEASRRACFEREFDNWIAQMEDEIESTRQSKVLTADDLATVINVR